MYGAVGCPLRQSRTVVTGKKADLVCKFLYILSYFIRCTEVGERSDTWTHLDELDPHLDIPGSKSMTTIRENESDSKSLGNAMTDSRKSGSLTSCGTVVHRPLDGSEEEINADRSSASDTVDQTSASDAVCIRKKEDLSSTDAVGQSGDNDVQKSNADPDSCEKCRKLRNTIHFEKKDGHVGKSVFYCCSEWQPATSEGNCTCTLKETGVGGKPKPAVLMRIIDRESAEELATVIECAKSDCGELDGSCDTTEFNGDGSYNEMMKSQESCVQSSPLVGDDKELEVTVALSDDVGECHLSPTDVEETVRVVNVRHVQRVSETLTPTLPVTRFDFENTDIFPKSQDKAGCVFRNAKPSLRGVDGTKEGHDSGMFDPTSPGALSSGSDRQSRCVSHSGSKSELWQDSGNFEANDTRSSFQSSEFGNNQQTSSCSGKPTLSRVPLVGRSDSMFDEYFTDVPEASDNVSKQILRSQKEKGSSPDIVDLDTVVKEGMHPALEEYVGHPDPDQKDTKSAKYDRYPSVEGSLSIFDEYFQEEESDAPKRDSEEMLTSTLNLIQGVSEDYREMQMQMTDCFQFEESTDSSVLDFRHRLNSDSRGSVFSRQNSTLSGGMSRCRLAQNTSLSFVEKLILDSVRCEKLYSQK